MYFSKFTFAKKEPDLQIVRLEMKVFKSALNDLITLSKQALQTLTKAIENVTKRKDKAMLDKKAKKPVEEVSCSVLDHVMERGTAFPEKNISEFNVPLGSEHTFLSFLWAAH